MDQPLGCLAARGDPPDEELEGPAVNPDWLESNSSAWAVHQIEELLGNLDSAQLRAEVLDIVESACPSQPHRRSIDQRLRKLPAIHWDAGSLYEDANSTDH
jgi:hypothetical protein